MEVETLKSELLARIQAAGDDRYRLLPELQKLIRTLEGMGAPVSANLHHMLIDMEDEASEAALDNFPV